jgi:hypothetical protein
MVMKERVFELSVVKGSVYVYCTCLLILLSSLLFPISCNLALNAQETRNTSGNTSSSQSSPLKNSTNAGSLDVLLEPKPYPATVNSESMKFEISFLKPNTSQLQDHVDFNVRMFKANKQVFQASNQTGQPLVPLHATDGYMTVPVLNYQFDQAGKYLIEIPVYGILFNPIRPESANFTIDIGS